MIREIGGRVMKRLIGVFSVILVSTVVLVGCQNNQNTNKEKTQTSVTKKKVKSSSSSKTSSEISQSKEEAEKDSKIEEDIASRNEASEEKERKEEKTYLMSNDDVDFFLDGFSRDYTVMANYLDELISALKTKDNNPDLLNIISSWIENTQYTDFNKVEFGVSLDIQNKVRDIMYINKELVTDYSSMNNEAKKAMDSKTYEMSPEFTQAYADYQVTIKKAINQIAQLKTFMEQEDDE